MILFQYLWSQQKKIKTVTLLIFYHIKVSKAFSEYNIKAIKYNSLETKTIFAICVVSCYYTANITIQQKIINSDFLQK